MKTQDSYLFRGFRGAPALLLCGLLLGAGHLLFARDGYAVQQATRYTVNTVDDTDDGTCDAAHCSLREAIDAANANAGVDTIAFDIAGGGPHTIQPATVLPTISDPAVIDGTTEPDFAGGPIIELDGSRTVPPADGLRITAGGTIIAGLAISSFTNGILLQTAGANIIRGNHLGTGFRAIRCLPNTLAGIRVESPDNLIGGTGAADGNVIGCSGTDGVQIVGASGVRLERNLIGIDATETVELPNTRDGVRLQDASGNVIGGANLAAGNLIDGNGGAGVSILGGTSTDNRVERNAIRENGGAGLALPDAGARNTILSNTIHGNGGLGIDLGPSGVTANDNGDADAGPNDLLNFPVIQSALVNNRIAGTLSTRPGSAITVEFFSSTACDDSDHGEGEILVASSSVTTDASGAASFSVTASTSLSSGSQVTATATDADGNSSEFSRCVGASDFSLTMIPDSVVVAPGFSANYEIRVTPIGGAFGEPVALTCSGLPSLSSCSFAPENVTPGAAQASVILEISTTGPSGSLAARADQTSRASLGPALLVLIALAGLWLLDRALQLGRRSLPLALLLIPALYSGCGDDSSGPDGGRTPEGRYTITVTGTSPSLVRESEALLIVQ